MTGVLLTWIIIGQGPAVLAGGACGVSLLFYLFFYHFFVFLLVSVIQPVSAPDKKG